MATPLSQLPATPTVEVTIPAVATPAPTATPGLVGDIDGLPWWNDTIFYPVFVRSFYDSSGDGIGDLNGLIQKLDYLQDLGIRGIWLMPIMASPSYHGCDVVDNYQVNPEYGANEDFKRLMAEAHGRGIRVIIDLAQSFIDSANLGSRTRVAIAHHHVVHSYPPGQYATFLANHDQNRVTSQLGVDANKAKLAASLQLTSPGVPFIYYTVYNSISENA